MELQLRMTTVPAKKLCNLSWTRDIISFFCESFLEWHQLIFNCHEIGAEKSIIRFCHTTRFAGDESVRASALSSSSLCESPSFHSQDHRHLLPHRLPLKEKKEVYTYWEERRRVDVARSMSGNPPAKVFLAIICIVNHSLRRFHELLF